MMESHEDLSQELQDTNERKTQKLLWTKNIGKWSTRVVPLLIVAVFVAMVVFFPITGTKKKFTPATTPNVCHDSCSLRLVESIPQNLTYNSTVEHMSTYDAWVELLSTGREKADMTSFYWSLRGNDTFADPSDWQGESIFRLLKTVGTKLKLRIAQNLGDAGSMSDSAYLEEHGLAKVRSVNMKKLFKSGVLHTKLWTVDDDQMYVGSANMDWRSLTQVKELGALVQNCSCLVKEAQKLFDVYWMMGIEEASLPAKFPPSLTTTINAGNQMQINLNGVPQTVYMSASPPAFSPPGREEDLSAIVSTMNEAKEFIHCAVMDYSPSMLYTPVKTYWPYLDDAIRSAAFRGVHVKLLFSHWRHTKREMYAYLDSLVALNKAFSDKYDNKGSIEVMLFSVPSFTPEQAAIPFARVNHNKYMVTERTAYIGTSNWSGDYFTTTGGAGLVITHNYNSTDELYNMTTATQLNDIFMRDWNSKYSRELY